MQYTVQLWEETRSQSMTYSTLLHRKIIAVDIYSVDLMLNKLQLISSLLLDIVQSPYNIQNCMVFAPKPTVPPPFLPS